MHEHVPKSAQLVKGILEIERNERGTDSLDRDAHPVEEGRMPTLLVVDVVLESLREAQTRLLERVVEPA